MTGLFELVPGLLLGIITEVMKAKCNRTLVFFCLLTWLAILGCVSPGDKFTWQKDPAGDGHPRRVLVVYLNQDGFGQLEPDFHDRLARRLTEALNRRGVPAEAVRLNPKDLDRTAPIARAAANFHPEQILVFQLTRLVGYGADRFGGRHASSATIEFTLNEVPKRRVLWRATANFLALPLPEDAANDFIEELNRTGLL